MQSLNVEEIEQLHEGPPEIPGENGFTLTHVSKPHVSELDSPAWFYSEDVLQQHQMLQGKADDVRKLNSDIQG